ncbi:MAG: exodeoxyribonuclease VII large subunit [Methylovirgula sp.]|uniref:exodeoxyribonuclease VII large subunit n=1 Tax=Methylovirgula sp. TaxID=1978224 RepID=UPI0030761955
MPVPVITGLGHASDHSILDEVAWRSADTPSKALQIVKTILRRRAAAATNCYATALSDLDQILEQIVRPRLAAKQAELLHSFEITLAKRRDELRDAWLAVKEHLLTFRGELGHLAIGLDQEAQSLLARAGALPGQVGRETKYLHDRIAQGARDRWHVLAGKRPSPRVPADLADSLVARQTLDLERLFSTIEIAARRRLSNEGDRLGQRRQALDALGIDNTLTRGFALPLDHQRRIIRSADAARSIASFELIFRDGAVACRAEPHA